MVVEVIGFGGDLSSDEDYDDDPPYDPLDNSSVTEVLDKSSSTALEKELNRQTLKNTNFNSIKTNLLGITSIEIGPIVGGTGGKSKPLVSIGTFESRKEPLRVVKKITADGEEYVSNSSSSKPGSSSSSGTSESKNLKEPIRTMKPVTKSTPVKKVSPPPILRKTEIKTVQSSPSSASASILSKVSKPIEIPTSNELPTIPNKVPSTNLIFKPNTFSSLRKEINNHQLSPPAVPTPILIEASQPLDSLEPTTLFLNSRLNGGDDFDDSLEADSGLDVKDEQIINDKKSSNSSSQQQGSDSDTEKSGSNSDSGNETDCIIDGRLNKGLFVAIDENSGGINITQSTFEKLSPDSVISSEDVAEENQALIPEDLPLAPEPISSAPIIIPPILKRVAPPPPPPQLPINPIFEPEVDYDNMEESLYDDVASFKPQPEHEFEEEEEAIYDDCGTLKAQNHGSYDFMRSSENHEDDDDDTDPIPLRVNEGVEFLGIRRIDSELFLNKQSLDQQNRNLTPGASSTLRSGSLSPKLISTNKTSRKVNQFFSTIGKKAGAAFRSTTSNNSSSSQGIMDLSNSSPTGPMSPHRRSLSQDEVNITRTQELYGTLSPSNLKLRGLTPVLSKLSKLELNYNNNNNNNADEQSNKDPLSKKKKFSSSIKKFLKIGSKDHQLSGSEPLEPVETTGRHTVCSSVSPVRPPPPPPRVHSLDVLENPHTGPPKRSSHGTVKPARPPPPTVRRNQIEPSFMSVFTAPVPSPTTNDQQSTPPEPFQPPNKPRRKSSITNNRESSDGGAYTVNYLETTYNHITSLNFETLKLIASQTPAKIHGPQSKSVETNNFYDWSQFYVTDVEPLASGQGFVFYSSFWNDEEIVLLLQESLLGQNALEFDCIEPIGCFEDVVQPSYIPWSPSEYVKTENGIRVLITILPSCTVQSLHVYIQNPNISPSRKFYAILQSLEYWGKEEVKDLIVFHQVSLSIQTQQQSDNHSKSSPSPNFGLVYVYPARLKNPTSFQLPPSRAEFEHHIKQLLLGGSLLCDNDKYILLRRHSNSTTQETEAQFKLYLQLKLFGPQSNDLDKILRYRSEKQVTQWMDKERAFCMKDAIERTLQKQSEPISPLRKSFVEFLMLSDSCAKGILDFIVDLYPDTSL